MDKDESGTVGKKKLSRETSQIIMKLVAIHESLLKQSQESESEMKEERDR